MEVVAQEEVKTSETMSPIEMEKEKPVSNDVTIDSKEVVEVAITNSNELPVKFLSLSQFSITLIKNITGAGILCTPYAIKNMGIIGTIVIYFLMVVGNLWCSRLLIQVTDYCKKTKSKYPPKEIGNDYAIIMYHILGPAGYITFVVLYLFAIWGVQVATLISIVDFIAKLPWPEMWFSSVSVKRLVFHILSTLICLFFILLHDLGPIITAASLSIFALVISFLLLLFYGFTHYGITFNGSFWKPATSTSLFAAMGIPSFSLGYNFSFLSFYKELSSQGKSQSNKVTIRTISLTTVAMVTLPMLALFSYSAKEGGISQNILLMIPSNEIIAICVNVMMYLSCLLTYPIYSPPLNEVLEASVKNKKTSGMFVSDSKRLLYRIAQTVGISLVAWCLPSFGDIVSLVGGFVFTAISLVIPPVLHFLCFKNKQKRVLDCIGMIGFGIFMVVSTIYSGIILFSNM